MNTITEELKHLLQAGTATNQEAICVELGKLGHEVNQSKVSRLLRKVGAVKGKNELGEIVYRLPKEPAPPTPDSPLAELVLDISCNETTIVITTSPGSAQLIARLLDYQRDTSGILGSVAGDDTVLVIPTSVKKTQAVKANVEAMLG